MKISRFITFSIVTLSFCFLLTLAASSVSAANSEDLPFINSILSQNPLSGKAEFRTLGGIISAFLNLIFILAGTIMLVMLIYGAVQYTLSGGEKEKLAKARARLMWAIIGFVVIMISFLISQYVQEIFNARTPTLTPITKPDDASSYIK